MTDPTFEINTRGKNTARQGRQDPLARVAELEAENAALRRALARAGLDAGRTAERHGGELAAERAGRAADAVSAEAQHGRETAAGRADLAAERAGNDALRHANAALAESRAALREREERLHLVLDSAAEYAIVGMDLDRRVTSWNAGAERLLGWSGTEIVGRPADVFFTPEDRAAGVPGREAAGALTEGRANDERWHQRRDGTRFWANGLMLPLRDPGADPADPPIGLLKIMRDETGRRRAEEALRRSRAEMERQRRLYEAILTNTPDLAYVFDLGHRFVYANDVLLKMWGRTWEEAIGKTCLELGYEPWHAAMHDREIEQVVATKRPVRGEVPFTGAFGRRVYDYIFVPVLGADGQVEAVAGTTRDVTERKESEEALREGEARWRGLFERMDQGFVLGEIVHDDDRKAVDYRLVEVNAAWERMTGIPATAAVGRPFREVVPGIERFWIDTYSRVAETGEPARVERHVPPLGRWYEALAYRTGPGRFAALTLDVTERKAAEARRDAQVELGDRLRDLRDPAEIAGAAAEVIGRALGAARAGYAPVTPDGHYAIERDWTDGRVPSATGRFRVSDHGAAYAAKLAEGGAVAIADSDRDPLTAAVAANHAAHGVRAQLTVPLVADGRLAALIHLYDAEPRAWTDEEVAFARDAAERTWAAAERARAERRRALLMNELNHRVKNTLAVVQSIAAQTARGAADLPAFSTAFQARLIALARAHDLLTRTDWEGAALGDVVRAALDPNTGGDEGRVDLGACGSDAVLAPPQALALAMALHELATNALKHGALSVPGGRVAVACLTDPGDGAHVVEWVERGGPPIPAPPARRGFGLRLLERGLATQAGMAADLRFELEGLRCTLRLPPPPMGSPAKAA